MLEQDHSRGVYLLPSIKGKEVPFPRNSQFFISAKIQDGRQKVAKTEIFPLGTEYCCTTLRVKNSLEITLSLTISKIFSMFYFPLKSKMAAKSGENWNFSPLHRTLLYYPASQKVRYKSLYRTVFKIFTLFHFPLKSKMAAKSGENWNFSPLYRILLYYPVGQKFARNHSISYGFRDIHTSLLHFPLKSKMAAKSGEKWNFSPRPRILLY